MSSKCQSITVKYLACEWFVGTHRGVVFFRRSAENQADLSMHRVTHILNAAHSNRRGQPGIYEGMRITYMGIEAHDSCGFDMSVNFQAAADFIHRALSRGGERRATKRSFKGNY